MISDTPVDDAQRTADLYEVTWMSGYVETVEATVVNFSTFRTNMFNGMRLVLSAREADIGTIRRVTDGEEIPQS